MGGLKPALSRCRFECAAGCEVHATVEQPAACQWFTCPYLAGDAIHRPDTFQRLLETAGGSISNFVPAVAAAIPVDAAETAILKTRTLPAAIMVGNTWVRIILPLDCRADATWRADEGAFREWDRVYRTHGITLPEEFSHAEAQWA